MIALDLNTPIYTHTHTSKTNNSHNKKEKKQFDLKKQFFSLQFKHDENTLLLLLITKFIRTTGGSRFIGIQV